MTEPIGEAAWTPEPEPAAESMPQQVEAEEPDDETLDPRAREALSKVRNEARNLRTRLKATEADNEKYLTQIADHQRREIERIAAEHLVDAADVWRVDRELQQQWYDTEFGGVVGDKVVEAAKSLAASKPHLGRHTAPPRAQEIEGLKPGASPELKQPSTPTWAQALRGTGI